MTPFLLCSVFDLTLTLIIASCFGIADPADQDQTAENVQSDL